MKVLVLIAFVLLNLLQFSSVHCEEDEQQDTAFENLQAGRDFLEEKSEDEDVVTLPSGLMYRVIESATNPNAKSPDLHTPCRVHYEGRLIDGTVFDSSKSRGEAAIFAPKQLIKGWSEALLTMQEGDIWELYVPSELAYGEKGAGERIGPNSVLVFEVNLLEVDPEFEGFEKFTRMLQREIPGLPFRLSVWQGILLLFYFFLRLYIRQNFRGARAAAGQTGSQQQPSATAASTETKKTK